MSEKKTRRTSISATDFATIWSKGVAENQSLKEIVEEFTEQGYDVDAAYVGQKSAQVRKQMLKASEGKITLPKLTKRDRGPVDVEALLACGVSTETEE